MENIRYRHSANKGGGRCGGARGLWRSLDTCVLKAPADALSEKLEGHLGVWTLDVEKEVVMANVQVDSFSQEGAGESHWANG
jgi:hypothetical protein